MKLAGSILFLLTWFTLMAVGFSVDDDCNNYFSDYPRGPIIPSIGSRHTVTCIPSQVAFQWFKGGTALQSGGCECDISAPSNFNLTFRSFRPEDAGNYSCRVNMGGGTFRTCAFEVLEPEIPSVALPSPSRAVNSGEPSLVVNPTISFGRPRGTFEWLFEGNPLQPSSPHIDIDSSTGTLTFTDIQSFHRGRYTIRVSNDHGANSANFTLTVYFLVRPTLEVQNDKLVCTVVGFWDQTENLMFDWNPSPNIIDPAVLPPLNSTTLQAGKIATISTCELYVCTVSVMSIQGIIQGISEGARNCGGPRVTAVSNTAVRVTWTAVGDVSSYHIRYGLVGQPPEERLVTPSVTVLTLEIMGLVGGMMYEFELGTVAQLDSTLLYSTATQLTLGSCNAPAPSESVKNVRAGLHSQRSRKTVRLTWDSLSGASGYRVSVNTRPPQSVIVTDTSFTLDSDYCNGTYQYTVEAVNECNIGSSPRTVSFTCANLIQFSTIKMSDQTFTFRIDGNSSLIKVPMSIMITTILPQDNDFTITSTYDVQTFSPVLCVMNLQKDTYYNICLCVESEGIGGGEQKICIQQKTGSEQDSSVSGCLEPIEMTTSKIEGGPSPAGFPDWAIAVIVVGCLALVALGFCFVGVYYACSSNKSKEYIYGSTPSLQASSVNMPHSMHNAHRSTSPPRSCLSYHHSNGHSTNWNEHRNTLRQMETDKGTHV